MEIEAEEATVIATGGGVPCGTLTPLPAHPAFGGQKKGRKRQQTNSLNPIRHPHIERSIEYPSHIVSLLDYKGSQFSVADVDLDRAIASVRFNTGRITEIILTFRQLRMLANQINAYLDTPEEI